MGKEWMEPQLFCFTLEKVGTDLPGEVIWLHINLFKSETRIERGLGFY